MKVLKKILLFIFSAAVIAVIIGFSVYAWGFIVLFQSGSIFRPKPPVYWMVFDYMFLLPFNISLIVLAAILLSRIGEDKSTAEKSLPKRTAKRAVKSAAVIALAVGAVVLYSYKDTIEYKMTDAKVNAYVRQADEIICYENSGDKYMDGMFDTDIKRTSMLLDYDGMTVTFLYRMSGDIYKRVELSEGGFVPDEDHILQFKNPLEDGGEVRVYYDKNNGDSRRPSIRSCAVTVEHNGKVFGAHFVPENLDFESCLESIYALEDSGLETLIYHDNELLPYTGGVKSETLFIDYDNKKLHFVYFNDSGFGVPRVCCYEYELTETDKVENVYLQAEYTLESGTKLYAYGNEDYTKYAYDTVLKWQTATTDGLVLEYDGKLYRVDINTLNGHHYDFLHSTGAVKFCRRWSIG